MYDNPAELIKYVKPELLWLIPILITIGYVIKNAKQPKDWLIPVLLLSASLALSISFMLINEGLTPMSAWAGCAQGLIVWAISIASHVTIKQLTVKRGT